MIILLNGTSSGKSTLAQTLQQKLGDGWISFSMDGYLSILGYKYWGLHPDNPNAIRQTLFVMLSSRRIVRMKL